MTENPYQTPLDTDKKPELSDPDRTQQGNLDHRFWVALLVCPITAPNTDHSVDHKFRFHLSGLRFRGK